MYAPSHATARIRFISLLIAYALMVSLLAPFAIRRAQASAVTKRVAIKSAPSIDSANREVFLNPSTQLFGKRSGDLLGRFSGGVSEFDKPQPHAQNY